MKFQKCILINFEGRHGWTEGRTEGRTLLQLDTSWVFTVQFRKFKVPNKGPFVSAD